MTQVVLGRADLALLSDLAGSRVVIPRLTAMPVTRGRERMFVRFVGDEYPTAFRGEGRQSSYALTCRYARKRHAELLALRTFLHTTVPAAMDPRMLLRTHYALVAGLDEAVAVEVDGPVTETISAAMVDVTFTVQVVQYTPAV